MNDRAAPAAAAAAGSRSDLPVDMAVLFAAVVGRLPALGAWWTLDDWGLLARAAGVAGADPGGPARWLGQDLWWALTWPLLGLNADAQAVLRIGLHALAALLVVRLAARAGLPPAGRLLAGLMTAGTPLAFTPLYWASGVQELLATTCALGAVLCFASPGRGRLAAAGVLALASMASKEVGLGLPVIMAALLLAGDERARHRHERPLAWALVLFLSLASAGEALLVVRHFNAGSDAAYRLGDAVTVLGNLGIFGFWMISPGPVYASALTVVMALAGGGLFMLWASWAVAAWRRGSRLPALALLAALVALAPALPLAHHIKPYMAYAAVPAAALTLGALVPRNLGLRPAVLAAAAVLVTIGGFAGMRVRQANRNQFGLPADPVVRATALSWQATALLRGLPPATGEVPRDVVLLQLPVDPASLERSEQLGEAAVNRDELYRAVGGLAGVALAAGDGFRARWANGLVGAPPDALVLAAAGDGFRVWGPTPNALLYAALTDVALGHFERARVHLVRAAALGGERIAFMYDEDQMIVPVTMVLARKEAFIDWTLGEMGDAMSPFEVGGVQELFFNLLSRASGRPVAELTEGSRVVGSGPRPSPKETP